jgi:hypothetical protein
MDRKITAMELNNILVFMNPPKDELMRRDEVHPLLTAP